MQGVSIKRALFIWDLDWEFQEEQAGRKKITVVGAGYAGMSIASTLARSHEILILEINKEKIGKIKSMMCQISCIPEISSDRIEAT